MGIFLLWLVLVGFWPLSMSFDDHYVKNTFVLDLGDSGVRCGWFSLVVIGFGWLRLPLVLVCFLVWGLGIAGALSFNVWQPPRTRDCL